MVVLTKIHSILKRIPFSEAELASAHEGLLIVSNSIDPMHDISHVERMLVLFKKLLEEKKLLLNTLEQKITVLSIIWHDVWKSQRVRTWALPFWYDQFVEGIGSMRMFQNSSSFSQLPRELRTEISYTIRKHSNYQFFERVTPISKIVYDLDMLERFSWQRMHIASQALKLVKTSFILENSWMHVVFEEYYMEWLSKQKNFLYHSWAQEMIVSLKNEYLLYLEKLRIQLKKESYFAWYLPRQLQG